MWIVSDMSLIFLCFCLCRVQQVMTDDLFMIKVRQVAWELFKDKKMLVPALRLDIVAATHEILCMFIVLTGQKLPPV
jgi:hypothetical protein